MTLNYSAEFIVWASWRLAPDFKLENIVTYHVKALLEEILDAESSKAPVTQVIDLAIVGLRTPMHVKDASARIKQLFRKLHTERG